MIKRSTSGVDEEDELPWVDALVVAELPVEFDLLPEELWLLLPISLVGEFGESSLLLVGEFLSSLSLSRFVS